MTQMNLIASMVEYALNRISEALANNPDRADIMGALADEIHDYIEYNMTDSDSPSGSGSSNHDVLKDVRDYLSDLMDEFEINNPFSDYF